MKSGQTKVALPALPEEQDEIEHPIILTKGLTKQFGPQIAVRDVTFHVPRGQIFGFIGPSGSGKTTTIRMLTGFHAPTRGEAKVFNMRPQDFTVKIREKIGYMPQLFVLYPNLSVWENLNFVASIYGMSFFRKKRLNELLDIVELTPHKKKLARNISGGMQRRLSLAATMIHNPELIFLDEPTGGIDPVLRSKFWEYFRELQMEGRTLFVTTQYVSEAAYCDLVGVMGDGYLMMVDTPAGLRYRAYGGDIVDLRATEPLNAHQEHMLRNQPFVTGKVLQSDEHGLRIVVNEASTAIPDLLDWCRANGIEVESVEEFLPPFDQVFVELVKKEENRA